MGVQFVFSIAELSVVQLFMSMKYGIVFDANCASFVRYEFPLCGAQRFLINRLNQTSCRNYRQSFVSQMSDIFLSVFQSSRKYACRSMCASFNSCLAFNSGHDYVIAISRIVIIIIIIIIIFTTQISREKFEPEPGFEPGISRIPVQAQIFLLKSKL